MACYVSGRPPVRCARSCKPLVRSGTVEFLRRGGGALTMSGGAAIVFAPITGERPTETEIILMPVGMEFKSLEGQGAHDIHDVKSSANG